VVNKLEDFRITSSQISYFSIPQLIIFIAQDLRRLTYDSPHIKPLRKWMDDSNGKDTPINSKLHLWLYMDKSKDVQLLKDLAPFSLPPFNYISIDNISKAAEEVKHFLYHSIGQLRTLSLNCGGLLDGSEWEEVIVKTLPRVKEAVYLINFSFSKEQVEAIVDNSLHLQFLKMFACKFRKWCFVSLVQID
jgi:hypothetical protein